MRSWGVRAMASDAAITRNGGSVRPLIGGRANDPFCTRRFQVEQKQLAAEAGVDAEAFHARLEMDHREVPVIVGEGRGAASASPPSTSWHSVQRPPRPW
jgi:hypothetical protein